MISQRRGSHENEYHGVHVDAPKLASLVVCCLAVYHVYASAGMGIGFVSAVLTAFCVAPLFNSHVEGVGRVSQEATQQEENQSSQIFTEADPQELDLMREEEHSLFGRVIHRGIELWGEDIEEIIDVATVLRENQGLLILLIGGVSSMMMALVAGLDDVNVLKALLLSITCYGITTLLVARSARRIANQHVSQNGESKKISSAETFVPNDELERCDLTCIEKMLHRRKIIVSAKECTPQTSGGTMQNLIDELRQRRNYNDSCCICLSPFCCGDRIRVLPGCRHEFHRLCIDKWAGTFAAKNWGSNCNARRGRPTCPLCNTSFGEAQVCIQAKSSQ